MDALSPGYVFLAMNMLKRLLRAVDEFQQQHVWVGFPVAVWKKFGDDEAGNLAALIAYSALVAIFPLLLLLITVLDIVLKNNPELKQKVLKAAADQYPVIGPQLQGSIGHLSQKGIALELAAERAQLGVGDPLRPPPRLPVVLVAQRRPDHRDRGGLHRHHDHFRARGRRRPRAARCRLIRAVLRGIDGAELRAVLAGLQ